MVDDPVKRVDNMAMASGLETRVPFLDHDVVELAARIPAELKVRGGGKYILKEASRGLVPDAVIDRPKGYFPVPALKYIRGAFLDFVRDVLDDAAGAAARIVQQALYRPVARQPGGRTHAEGPFEALAGRAAGMLVADARHLRSEHRTMGSNGLHHGIQIRSARPTTSHPDAWFLRDASARIFAPDDQFQFGIEEEYFLSDAETGEVPAETPDALFQAADFGTERACRPGVSAGADRGRDRAALRRQRSATRAAASCGRTRRRPPPRTALRSWLAARIRWRCGASRCRARRIATTR